MSLQQLPANLSLVLDSTASDTGAVYVVRLAHVYPVARSTHGPASVDLGALFRVLRVVAIEEMTADAVAPLAAAQASRLRWTRQTAPHSDGERTRTHAGDGAASTNKAGDSGDSGLVVTLQPMQLRTFRVTVAA